MPINRMLAKQQVATYAECLLAAAQESGRAFEDIEDLKSARRAVTRSSQMREFLQDPNISAENKSALVKDVFSGLAPEVVSVVAVMAERCENQGLLGRVATAYEEAAEKALDMVVVDVATAVPPR